MPEVGVRWREQDQSREARQGALEPASEAMGGCVVEELGPEGPVEGAEVWGPQAPGDIDPGEVRPSEGGHRTARTR